MSVYEIEKMRQKLNDMVDKFDCTSSEVLEVSKEMDILLLSYIKGKISRKEDSVS